MERKLRHSRQRERIYDYLKAARDHPSAENIYEALRAEIPGLSLGTVYRNLRLLEETGRIRRVITPQNAERYDARCYEHAHFVCDLCGRVRDMDAPDYASLKESCAGDDRVMWVNVTFGGQCRDCLREQKAVT
ncbi:MAG: transcriptional repressor [Clostridia bacterium]|nr:transcriptional repressor [Clostridia bacterium]